MQGAGAGLAVYQLQKRMRATAKKKNSPAFAKGESMVTNDTHWEKTHYKRGEGGGLAVEAASAVGHAPSAFKVVA